MFSLCVFHTQRVLFEISLENKKVFIKIGKKGLTNAKKDAIIVNCIIIARTVGFLTECDKSNSNDLFEKSSPYKEKHSGKQPIPERYHYFEWSD